MDAELLNEQLLAVENAIQDSQDMRVPVLTDRDVLYRVLANQEAILQSQFFLLKVIGSLADEPPFDNPGEKESEEQPKVSEK